MAWILDSIKNRWNNRQIFDDQDVVDLKKENEELLKAAGTPYPTVSSGDMTPEPDIRLPRIPFNMFLYYLIRWQSVILRTIVLKLKQEIFRETLKEGFDYEPKFKYKCVTCGTEYQEETEQCECGGELRKPNPAQKKFFDKFAERVNEADQSFLEVCEELEDDVNTADDMYLVIVKDYMIGPDGQAFGRPIEFMRGDPCRFRIVGDEAGRRGGRYWTCVNHRNQAAEKMGNCEEKVEGGGLCGLPLHDVHYVETQAGGKNVVKYYIEGEVIHASKYEPSRLYGVSPVFTCWIITRTLQLMDRYAENLYEKGRLKGVLGVSTENVDYLRKWWSETQDKLRQDPHYMPVVAVESGERGKGKIEFVKLMDSLSEMQATDYKKELRLNIAAIFGIMPIFQADVSTSGGLNNEGLQITVSDRTIDFGQAVYHNKVYPKVAEMLFITDWNIKLKPSREHDEMAELERMEKKISSAQMMLDMGFDVKFEEDKFIFSGEAKKRQLEEGAFQEQLPPPQEPKQLPPGKPPKPEDEMEDEKERVTKKADYETKKIWTCNHCGKKFDDKLKAQWHLKDDHNNFKYLMEKPVFSRIFTVSEEKRRLDWGGVDKALSELYEYGELNKGIIPWGIVKRVCKHLGMKDKPKLWEQDDWFKADQGGVDMDCVGKKIKIFESEHSDWKKDQVVAAALNHCRGMTKADDSEEKKIKQRIKDLKAIDPKDGQQAYEITRRIWELEDSLKKSGDMLAHYGCIGNKLKKAGFKDYPTRGKAFKAWWDKEKANNPKARAINEACNKAGNIGESDEDYPDPPMTKAGESGRKIDKKVGNVETIFGRNVERVYKEELLSKLENLESVKSESELIEELGKLLEKSIPLVEKQAFAEVLRAYQKGKRMTPELDKADYESIRKALDDEAPDYIDEDISPFNRADKQVLETIYRENPFWKSFAGMNEELSAELNEIIKEGYEAPTTPRFLATRRDVRAAHPDYTVEEANELTYRRIGKMSLPKIIEKMKRSIRTNTYRLERIARTETTGVTAKGREEALKQRDTETKYLYEWFGPMDHRTSDICKEIESRVDKAGGGKGVPLQDLKDIMKSVTGEIQPKWGYREWVPHANCRRVLRRKQTIPVEKAEILPGHNIIMQQDITLEIFKAKDDQIYYVGATNLDYSDATQDISLEAVHKATGRSEIKDGRGK
jgi:hypothetical protein